MVIIEGHLAIIIKTSRACLTMAFVIDSLRLASNIYIKGECEALTVSGRKKIFLCNTRFFLLV